MCVAAAAGPEPGPALHDATHGRARRRGARRRRRPLCSVCAVSFGAAAEEAMEVLDVGEADIGVEVLGAGAGRCLRLSSIIKSFMPYHIGKALSPTIWKALSLIISEKLYPLSYRKSFIPYHIGKALSLTIGKALSLTIGNALSLTIGKALSLIISEKL